MENLSTMTDYDLKIYIAIQAMKSILGALPVPGLPQDNMMGGRQNFMTNLSRDCFDLAQAMVNEKGMRC